MSENSRPVKHLYSHDVRLRKVGASRRLQVTCHSPECGHESLFYAVTMTQDQWVSLLHKFYKKHRTFKVKHEGRQDE